MSEVVRFETRDGAALLVEVDDEAFGMERVSRRGGSPLVEAGEKLEDVLAAAQATIRAVVGSIRALAPDEAEIEFGLKLNAEVGVLVAKTAMEGHFVVKLAWHASPYADVPPPPEVPAARPGVAGGSAS